MIHSACEIDNKAIGKLEKNTHPKFSNNKKMVQWGLLILDI